MAKHKVKQPGTFKPWLVWQLRKASYKWPPRGQALKAARVERGKYECARCGKLISSKELAVDHIEPIVNPKIGFVNWAEYIERMFCPKEGFQILCRQPCHQDKTKAESTLRAKFKSGAYSEEANKRNSESHKGHTYLRGIPKTLAHKLAMSKERKGKAQTEARKKVLLKMHSLSKRPVIGRNTETGKIKIFDSIGEATLMLGIVASNISKVCNEKENRSQAGGWEFRFKTAREKGTRKEYRRRMKEAA